MKIKPGIKFFKRSFDFFEHLLRMIPNQEMRRVNVSDRRTHAKGANTDSREALLQAAKHVFAMKGFAGATVKDLADAAKVNSSLVSYHFGGKEGLYRSCLESFAMDRLESNERILSPPKSREEFSLRLRLFAEEMISIHEREANIIRMIHRGLENLDPLTVEIFKDVFYRIFGSLRKFIEAAQASGIVRADLDAETTTGVIFGSLMHNLRCQDLAKMIGKPTLDDPEYRTLFIDHLLGVFSEGLWTTPKDILANAKEGRGS
jgi:AcrR family transcriptional regulator